MPIFFVGLILFGITKCNSYLQTKKTREKYKTMKKPAILYYKTKHTFWYSVTLKDADNKIYDFPNSSTFGDSLGEIYNIGDTIK